MIVEQRTYTLYPGQHLKYLEAYEKEGLEIQRPILGNLVGYFFHRYWSAQSDRPYVGL